MVLVRKEIEKNLDNSKIILDAYSLLAAVLNYSKSDPLYC